MRRDKDIWNINWYWKLEVFGQLWLIIEETFINIWGKRLIETSFLFLRQFSFFILSGLLWACLTSTITHFGRSSRVTYADDHLWCIYPKCMHPWCWCMCPWCIYPWWMYLRCMYLMWSLLVTDKRTHRLTYSRIRKNARWKQCCAIRDSAWWRLGEEAMAPAGVIYDLGKETQSIPG